MDSLSVFFSSLFVRLFLSLLPSLPIQHPPLVTASLYKTWTMFLNPFSIVLSTHLSFVQTKNLNLLPAPIISFPCMSYWLYPIKSRIHLLLVILTANTSVQDTFLSQLDWYKSPSWHLNAFSSSHSYFLTIARVIFINIAKLQYKFD